MKTRHDKTAEQDKDAITSFKTVHSTFPKLSPKSRSVEILADIGPEDSASQVSQSTQLSYILKEHISKLQTQKDELDKDAEIEKKKNNHQITFPN